MGPLVPDIIGPNLNFVFAIAIGVAFGWILEQAGFSTSKKLVGLFYGYDFTVLRVFFTGGVVAMFGVIALQHFGMLDINLIYINPTFIWSALVGGLIMGLGFVIGGFCPGTSVCAAAIGKIDAMLFVAGSFLGVLLFAEGYPWFEGLYKAGHWGSPQIFETMGIAKPVFVLLLTAVALVTFWAVTLVEDRVNGRKRPAIRLTKVTATVGIVGLVVALSGFALPSEKDLLLARTAAPDPETAARIQTMTADELAFRLLDEDPHLQIIDFRSPTEMKKLPLPRAVAFTADNLFEKEPMQLFATRHKLNVIVADDEAAELRMAAIARELGHENVRVLAGGLAAFERDILRFDTTQTPASRQEIDTFRFRTRASRALPALIAAQSAAPAAPKVIKRAAGGC
jgi:rhodanese-related sulfurtransferase